MHTVTGLSAPSGDLGDTISGRLVYSPSRPQSFTPTPSSANEYARPCRLCSKQKEIRTGPDSGYPVSRNLFTSGLRGSFPSRVQSLGDSCSRTPSILPPCTSLCSSVPAYGVTHWASGLIPLGGLYLRPLQRHFHSLGLTDRFTQPRQSDPLLVGANLLRRWQDPRFSYLRNPSPHVPGGVQDFYGRLHAGVGRSHGGFPDFGYLDPYRPQAPHQLFGAQGGILCPTTLGSNAPGPPVYDRYGQFDSSFVYQQTRRVTFPHLVAADSLASPLLWLEAQNIIVRARHIPGCLNVIADHLSRPNQPIPTEWSLHPEIVRRIFRVWGTPEVDMFVTLSNSHLPRVMSPIPRALAVDALSQDWQGRSMYMFSPFPLLSKSCRNCGTLRWRR